MWHDLRYALRMLAKNPGFTAVVVITLALGIGANSAIFSLVNAVLLRPLPYAQPQQLVRIYSEFPTFPNGGLHKFWLSGPEYLELKASAKSWQSLDAWTVRGANLSASNLSASNLSASSQPLRVQMAAVTGGLLSTLGVPARLGRNISPSDDQPGAPRVADISWNLWQSAFGGDRGVVGREVELSGEKCTIVGVMPPRFEFPLGQTDAVSVWTPLQLNPASPGNWSSHYLYMLGRLQSGISLARAQAEFHALVVAWGPMGHSAHQHNFTPDNHPISSYPLQQEVTGNVRPALLMLLGAVGFVLLIACVNVASLLLARAEARQREIAIRSALGARSSRLLRQFVTEGIVLALLGAGAGLLLARLALGGIQVASAGTLPLLAGVTLDGRVLWFTLGLALLTGIVFGLTPLAHAGGKHLFGALKASGGGAGVNPAAQRFRQGLVVAEIALALVLLVGAGLMVRAFWNLQRVDIGFQPDGLMTMQVALPSTASDSDRDAFMQRLESSLGSLAGVRSAALVSGLPPNRSPNDNDTDIEGFVRRVGGPIENVEYYQTVSPSYFSTMGIGLVAGRYFDARDGAGSPDVVIVNRRMAETFWPGQSPLGHRIRPGQSGPWVTVVGEVADVKNKGVGLAAGTEIYLPLGQKDASGQGSIYIVTRGAPGAADGTQVAAVRALVHQLDPSLPLSHVESMEQVLGAAQAQPRFLTWLLLIFAAVALALAAVGIYGVMSYTVARRTREFGLRAAIGAGPGDLLGLVMRQGLGLALVGIAAGAAVALAATRLLGSQLFEVGASDPATYAAMAALLLGVALAACLVPAWRATRVDPMVALRED